MDNVITVPEGTQGFPLGVSVEIRTEGDTKYVTILARLHLNKRFELPHCYAATYTTADILRDHSFHKYLNRYI
jgi:hypothetical protein